LHRRGAQDRAHYCAKMHKNASTYAFLGFFEDFWGAKRERLSSLFYTALHNVSAVYFTLNKN
jgi:hypothetical protein